MKGFIRLLLPAVIVTLSACTKREPQKPGESTTTVTPSVTEPAVAVPGIPSVDPKPTPKPKPPTPPPTVDVGGRKILVRDCLLRLPKARRVGTTALPRDRDRLAALTDNDAATSAVLPATRDLPLDVVYHFDGAEVTPLELVVLLPETAPANARTARVEVLTSTVSADTGFQLVRADPLESTGRVQRFRLRPQAAKWAMVRFIPGMRAERVAVAEVALLGKVGPPQSPYSFKESPTKAIDLIDKLKGLKGVSVALTREESDLIADVKDGKFRKWPFVDAALFVSGVTDADKRKEYRDKISALVAEAKKDLGGVEGAEARSEKLLQLLHAKALAGGYVAGQTDVPPILDRGVFNCVSSAVLYNVLAKELKLDVRGIQVPDHAFSIVYDGTKHFDVETTTVRGFNPLRDKAAVAEFERITGFTYIPDSDRDQRREVTDAGMLAMIYYNHGVDRFDAGDYPAALAAFFRALSLDRELVAATKNALYTLAAWAVSEGMVGKFSEAQAIVRTGLDLAPNDMRLRYARARVWAEYADREFARGGLDAGVAALREAAADAPDGPFVQLQSWLVIRPGEPLVAEKKWEDAITLVEPFLTKVDPPAREELLRWRGGVFIRWANEEIAAGRYESALGIIERGLKLHPKDGRFPDLLTAVARNWVETTHAEKGKEGAMAVVTKLEELGKNHPDLRPAARRAAYWLVIELREAGKPEEAEALLSAKIPVVKGEKDAKEILRDVYDHWAGALLDKGDYRGAFGVYLKALDKLPDDPVMIAHLAYVVHRWLGAVEKAEGADKMKELIVQLRKEHPKLKDFIGLTPAAAWAGIKVLRDAGQYADALDALDRFADLLSKSDDVRKMYRIVYDDWAADFTKKKDPAFAVDVYEMALRRFPSDTHVWHNLGVTIQDWALALQADGREGEAKAVLLRALIRFPGVPNVAKAARNHLPLVVQDLRDAGKYTEALAVLDRHWDLLQDLHKDKADAERNEIGGGVYDIWAKTFIDKKDWDSAIAKYNEGLKVFKNSSLLKRNRQYCVDMKKRGK